MMRFYQKKKGGLLYSKWSILILFCISLFLAKAAWNAYNEMKQTKREALRAEEEFTALSLRSETLAYDIERLGTEEGVEKEIRKRFSVAKEGEQVVVIVDGSGKVESEVILEEKSFFQKLFESLKSMF